MAKMFIAILNMSLTASIIIAIVLLARLCLKKAPKIYSYLLWAVVLFRLLCPISIGLPVSMLAPMSDASISAGSGYTTSMEYISLPERPDIEQVQPVPDGNNYSGEISNAGAAFTGSTSTDILESPAVVVEQQEKLTVGNIMLTILGWLWVIGMAGVLGITVWQTVSLRCLLADACIIRGNIFESEKIDTAFILGVFNPKIYLPLGLPFDIQKAVITHEQTHQRRGDHIAKLVSYIALAIHWFNPLVWLSFKLMCDDMEKSCDEAVIRTFYNRGYPEKNVKKGYSEMLFALGGGKQHIFSPVSFAEHSTKERIVNVGLYKKMSRNAQMGLIIGIVLITTFCVINPVNAFGKDDETDNVVSSNSDVRDTCVTNSDLEDIKNVEEITIGGTTFDRNVTSLSLKGRGITDISELSACTELITLDLSDNNISDVSALAGLKHLQTLYVSNNNISDISILTSLNSLEELYIDGNPITDYSVIRELDKLYKVSINADILESKYINALCNLSKLTICGKSEGNISSADISVLQSFPSLFHITLKNCIAEDYSVVNNFVMAKNSMSMIFEMEVDNLDDYTACGLDEITKTYGLFITYEKGNSLSILEGITEVPWIRIEKRDYTGYDNDIDESPILTLKDFSGLESCTGVTELDIIGLGKEYDLSVLSNLPKLSRLGVVGEMENIDFIECAPNINTLSVQGTFTDISPVSNLRQLRSLTLYGRYDDLSALSSLSQLQHIMLSGQFTDLSGIKNLSSLESIYIISDKLEDISALAELDNVSGRTTIESAAAMDYSPIAGMDALVSILIKDGNIDNLNFVTESNTLRSISLWDCIVSDASALNQATSLSDVTITDSTLIGFDEEIFRKYNESCFLDMSNCSFEIPNDKSINQNIPEAETVQLTIGGTTFSSDVQVLRLSDIEQTDIENLKLLSKCPNLEELHIGYTVNLNDFSWLSDIKNLKRLYFSDGVLTTDLFFLEGLNNLETLDIGLGASLPNDAFSSLTQCPNLKELIMPASQVTDLSFVYHLNKLEKLDIFGCMRITDYSPLSELRTLRSISVETQALPYISALPNLTEVNISSGNLTPELWSELSNLHQIERLEMYGCNIDDLTPLANLTSLRYLNLSYGENITDITPLKNLTNLEYLNLCNCNVYDITPLANLSELFWLDISVNNISDVSCLVGNFAKNAPTRDERDPSTWAELNVHGNNLTDAQIQELRKSLPNCSVYANF